MARTQRRRLGEGVAAPPSSIRENLPRPKAPPAAERAARGAPAPVRRRSPFAFLGKLEPKFVADIVSELRKVTWPSFAEVRYLTLVVAIVAVAVGALLGGLDLLFGWVIERLFF